MPRADERRSTSGCVKVTEGDRFGHLVAIKDLGRSTASGKRLWRFRCDCGAESITTASSVKSGNSKSCGCQKRASLRKGGGAPSGRRNPNFKHGKTNTSEFVIWRGMRSRCLDPRRPEFQRYGARGIGICERWKNSFVAFLEDVGPRPSPAHSIHRVDNSGDYEPGNCRWATRSEQARNTRSNRLLCYRGRIITLAEASEISGIDARKIGNRISRGWDAERALSTP